jgi:beta-galactosidase
LCLTADRPVIRSGCSNLAYISIEVQDAAGVPVKHGEPLISLEVSGAGELMTIGSGNPLSEELYVGNQHRAYHGRLLAIVRSAATPGIITLIAQTDGLPAATIHIEAK